MQQALTQPHAGEARRRPVKVLYLMGAARCGSTLLDNILNELDGFFSVGEIRFLWERLNQNRFCGCGKSFQECEVWSRVLEQVEGLYSPQSLEHLIARQRTMAGTWRTWQLLHQASTRHLNRKVEAQASLMGHLYRAIAGLTGARVIVDSSKRPWEAALLNQVEEVSPFFVHLVRDPRAMAHSQSKAKANPDRNGPAVMASTSTSRSALQWARWNLAADAVRRAVPDARSMLVSYSYFCSDPLSVVEEIKTFVGERSDTQPFVDEHTVILGGNHTVSGNPDRFRTGSVSIREDDKWKREMPRRERVVALGLTWPLLRRYERYTSEG
jgi:Sulfotransferase family